MPIIDITIVAVDEVPLRGSLAQELADTLGGAIGASAGRLWVRLQYLPSTLYAENGRRLSPQQLPVFVTLLHAVQAVGVALEDEICMITDAVSKVAGRPAQQVHVEYAPPGQGRIAFGGQLV